MYGGSTKFNLAFLPSGGAIPTNFGGFDATLGGGMPISAGSLSFNQGALPMASGPMLDSVSTPNLTARDATYSLNNPNWSPGGGMTGLEIGQLAIGGLQTLGGLWNAFQAQKLAKQQFRFQRDFAKANFGNSVQEYNTKLEDRINTRAFTEGRDASYAQSYLDKNRLKDTLSGFGRNG